MEIFGLTEAQVFGYFLVLLRTASLFVFAPVLSSPFVPGQVKAAAVLALSFSLALLGVGPDVQVPPGLSGVLALAGQEIAIGFVMGLVGRFFIAAIQFGGQVVGFQMGLGIVSVMDPQFEGQVSIVSQLQFLIAVLVFLAIGGDRMLLEAFVRNLEAVPPGGAVFALPLLEVVVHLSGAIFDVGLRLAAPVMAALFASHVVLGVFARSVPQMNMLILGFPLQILVGFTVLTLSLPHWVGAFARALEEMFSALRALPRVLG